MITLPTKPKIVNLDETAGVFEIENLYPGYGITIGNALRRILLSSLKGAAITIVKIKGVNHEFSTIEGIVEDVIEICLNLKQVRLRMFSDESQKMFLKVKGKKEVKAKDIETPSQIEIANPDLRIATLTNKNSELEMELTAETGLHYVPAEVRKREKLEVGTIILDAIFTPIRKVNFEVENMRVGDRTDYNKLIFHIESDGTISPKSALENAIKILIAQLNVLVEEEAKVSELKEEESKKEIAVSEQETVKEMEEVVKMKVGDLNLSNRIINILENNNLKKVGDLIEKLEAELLNIEGLGKKAVEEIKKVLKKLGLKLKE